MTPTNEQLDELDRLASAVPQVGNYTIKRGSTCQYEVLPDGTDEAMAAYMEAAANACPGLVAEVRRLRRLLKEAREAMSYCGVEDLPVEVSGQLDDLSDEIDKHLKGGAA